MELLSPFPPLLLSREEVVRVGEPLGKPAGQRPCDSGSEEEEARSLLRKAEGAGCGVGFREPRFPFSGHIPSLLPWSGAWPCRREA